MPPTSLSACDLSIDRVILYGDVRVVVARSAAGPVLLGLKTAPGPQAAYVFLPVPPTTVAALESGGIDLYSAIAAPLRDGVIEAPAQAVDTLVRRSGARTGYAGDRQPAAPHSCPFPPA